jgi:hypothetical protein
MRSKLLLNAQVKNKMTRDESKDWVGCDLDGSIAEYESGAFRQVEFNTGRVIGEE